MRQKNSILLLVGYFLIQGINAQNALPATGNVGIGTSSPQTALDVQNAIQLFKASAGDATLKFNLSGKWSRIGGPSSMAFWTNGKVDVDNIPQMFIASTGNVGVGTSNPVALLHVGSPASGTIASLKFGSAGDAGTKTVPLGGVTGGYNIDFAGWRDAIPDYIGARIRAERINAWQDNNALVQAVDLTFFTGSPNASVPLGERLRIKYNGNVGIGTSNPKELLSVNGKIRSKEVMVESANWPDYVFEESYTLRPLDSLSLEIKILGHLPEIPSSQEVSRDGLHLGEINTLLMKKVEELTLYILSQNDQMKRQKAQLLEQESRLEKLEKLLNTTKTK